MTGFTYFNTKQLVWNGTSNGNQKHILTSVWSFCSLWTKILKSFTMKIRHQQTVTNCCISLQDCVSLPGWLKNRSTKWIKMKDTDLSTDIYNGKSDYWFNCTLPQPYKTTNIILWSQILQCFYCETWAVNDYGWWVGDTRWELPGIIIWK